MQFDAVRRQPDQLRGTEGVSSNPRGYRGLTDVAARNAAPRDRDYKLSDSGGLFLFVTTTGVKSWRLKYRFDGKEKLLVIGRYPDLGIKGARSERDKAKAAISEGRDPALIAKRAKLIGEVKQLDTFEKHARTWFEAQKPRWKPVHAADVITSLERDIFPHLGRYAIEDIDEPLLLSVLQLVESRGAIETAHRLRQRCDKIFRYARATGTRIENPADTVKDAMRPVPKSKKWPALVDLESLRVLIRDVDRNPAQPVTKLASRFLAIVAQRPGMVRGLEWREIEGVDWPRPDLPSPAAVWKVGAERMKLEFDLRDDDAWDHWVPLPQQAVDVLHAVRPLTGLGPLAFPSNWASSDPMSENTVTALYQRIGYKGRHVPHGWRSSFSTIMNGRIERLARGLDRYSLDRLIIDLMLAHKPTGMSGDEFTYNRHAYMDRRRELATEWADLILTTALPPAELLDGPRRRPSR